MFLGSASLVMVELEVEAAAGLKGVEVERPGLFSSSSSLLVFWVEGILSCVKLLPLFWNENEKNGEDDGGYMT